MSEQREPVTMSADQINEGLERDPTFDMSLANRALTYAMYASPTEAWAQVLSLLDSIDAEDLLITMGVYLVEPLIDARGRELVDAIQSGGSSQKVRQVISCIMLSQMPPEVEAVVDALRPPEGSEDDIGTGRSDLG